MYIDAPANENVKSTMNIRGWVMTEDEEAEIKVYIDGEEKTGLTIEREEREDVINAIKGYGGKEKNPMPGFRTKVDTSDCSDGVHELKIEVYSRTNDLMVINKKQINIKKYDAKVYIDEPTNENVKLEMNVKGWLMTEDEEAEIKVYIDGEEKTGLTIEREEREDVVNSIEGYGGREKNPMPGFITKVDTSDCSDGVHELKIEVYSRTNEVIAISKKQINIKKYDGRICIDEPVNENVKLEMNVKGWVMAEDEEAKIKVYIDGEEKIGLTIEREEREDVLAVIKNYGGEEKNKTPGFRTSIDTSKYKDGEHELKIEVYSKYNEIIETNVKQINIKKYDSRICIDSPNTYLIRENSLLIRGWAMSELKDKEIIVKLDDNIQNVNIEERVDVLSAIKNYGGEENNPTPGFNVQINGLSNGEHKITVQIYSNITNEIIENIDMIVRIAKIEYGVGLYGNSGAAIYGVSGGSELRYYRFGSGPNVMFATFCVHGYEDSWASDGFILTCIADNFYNRLVSTQDYGIADKWTIYIFPEVNPDGRRLGYTNNGPGRTTLYSQVGKGIDINRCWQTGSGYTRYTSTRNYNGTSGFQAYEAEALRNFMLANKSTSGQTVVVDLHGWENQLLGNEQIANYYKWQYPSCSTRNYGVYGTQYLISWARQNLGAKATLVELPYAANSAQVDSMGLSEKYITATLQMLREV